MDKNRQIEEMTRLMNECCNRYDEQGNHIGNKCYECECWCDTNHICCSYNTKEALALYNAGYRKASEVAEEIEKYILEGASTIKSENSDCLYGAKFAIEKVVLPILEAYKKKYTEEEK